MKPKILIIDDEAIVLESCKRIFSAEGYEITTAGDPREGIRLATESKFDVVITDWKLPEMDGMEVLEIMAKISPDSTLLMFSGFPSVERATDALKRGAMDYIPKPFTPKEILDAVRKAEQRKVEMEKNTIEKAVKFTRNFSFPVPSIDDKAPSTIAEAVSQSVGVGKTTSPWLSVLVLGILAGAYIGFGGMLSTIVTHDMTGYLGLGFTKFMSGAVFSLGLMLVIIAGAELFTGNNLMISSALSKEITFGKMLERWGLVYIANFVGSLLIALLFIGSGLWKTGGNAVAEAAVRIAYAKVSLPFGEALLRAIGCNWLVCLAVWMALAARQTIGKIFAIFFPIMGFVAIGFEHCIANMYFIPAGIFLRTISGINAPSGIASAALSWGSFLWKNLLPVTIGNVIGGALFVGMGYWSAYLRRSKA